MKKVLRSTTHQPRQILHIDFDSYFASCEQQFNPKLRGKAIGVTAANGRTAIIAASREAKKKGVKNVTRVWEARKVCPEIITVPASFEKYWEITQKFLDICKDYSPYVELFSLDEVFIDITSTKNLFGGEDEIVKIIKNRIKNEIGEYVTVSVGLSHNKMLAKLASGMDKPNGFIKINLWDIGMIYSKVKLTDFCGIGIRTERRLNKIGINTPLQLRNASLDILISEFKDVEGYFLKRLGEGIDESEVIPYYLPSQTKSVGRSYCLPKNEYDRRIILQNIYELCEEIGKKLRKLNKKARTVGLYLGGEPSYHGRKTTTFYIDKGSDVFRICKILYESWNVSMVRQINIWAGNLEDNSNITLSLFDQPKNVNLNLAIDKLNNKFGHNTIRNGFVTNGPSLKTVPNGFMADRLERQKLVGNL